MFTLKYRTIANRAFAAAFLNLCSHPSIKGQIAWDLAAMRKHLKGAVGLWEKAYRTFASKRVLFDPYGKPAMSEGVPVWLNKDEAEKEFKELLEQDVVINRHKIVCERIPEEALSAEMIEILEPILQGENVERLRDVPSGAV